MHTITLDSDQRSRLTRLLVVGAHSDDIEIGCGGTVLDLARSIPDLEVTWVVLSASDARETEARASAAAFLSDLSSPTAITIHAFRDGYLPYDGGAVKDVFENLKGQVDPQLVLTHARDDAHQDHRLVRELTWNTFRDALILEYEVPKWDGDLGRPNVYVPLSAEAVDRKLELLLRHFPSQAGKHWFDGETFRGLMRLRGVECAAPSGFAEAFVGSKVALRV